MAIYMFLRFSYSLRIMKVLCDQMKQNYINIESSCTLTHQSVICVVFHLN